MDTSEGGERHAPRARLVAILVFLASIASCGFVGDDPFVKRDGPVIVRNDIGSDAMGAIVAGELVVRDGCGFLRSQAGTEALVVFPRSTEWDDDREVAVTPDGDTLAAGQQVSGGGGYLQADGSTDLMEDVRDVAGDCTFAGEVAVFNADSELDVS